VSEDAQGAFPMSVPVAHLAASSTSAQPDVAVVGGVAALLLVTIGGIAAASQNSDEEQASDARTVGMPATASAAAGAAPTASVATPAATASILTKESPKTEEEVAKAYDVARQEQLEIDRIKNDFIARLEQAGRQSTIRLETMGKTGIAASGSTVPSAVKEDSLPDEVFLRTTPMNLAKRNALEANRKQWGIEYTPLKPKRQ